MADDDRHCLFGVRKTHAQGGAVAGQKGMPAFAIGQGAVPMWQFGVQIILEIAPSAVCADRSRWSARAQEMPSGWFPKRGLMG